MNYDNVTLWFAKNEDGNIITIDDINDGNKKDTYSCPMCASSLIPKAVESKQVTSHFAHVDASKCTNESMIHWWFKNKFLEKGDSFVVVSDKERQYICKDILVEQDYKLSDGKIYNPDVTVLTECGSVIYFEMDYSNKKKIEDYIDTWLELKNIVVEVDIKKLMNNRKVPMFKALFYEGKCFNVRKNDLYYNTIGKHKEEILKNCVNVDLKERMQRLDWFWRDVAKYKSSEVDIEYMVDLIDCIDGEERETVEIILNKQKCNNILEQYMNKKIDPTYNAVCNNAKIYLGEDCYKYIEKYVGVTGYYYDKGIRGKIYVTNPSEKYKHSLDIVTDTTDHIIEQCNKYVQEIVDSIKRKELKNIWNNRTKEIISQINSDVQISDYIDKLKENKYDLGFWFSTHDENTYKLRIHLKYINSLEITAKGFEYEVTEPTDTSEILNYVKTKVGDYFLNLIKLKNVDDLNNLVKLLNIRYDYILKFCGKVHLEDTFKISITDHSSGYFSNGYYISNEGVMKGYYDDIVFKGVNIDLIYNYLIGDIDKDIREKNVFKCMDCENDFSFEQGEIKFYNQKGFSRPRRCKKCRKINKQNKV